jgi:hypothetical protein
MPPPSSPPPACSVELSASGVDLRRWIQEVQQRADEDARKTDPFGIADRKWSSSNGGKSSSAGPLPGVPFDVEGEASKAISSLPGVPLVVDKKRSKKTSTRSQRKKRIGRDENANRSNCAVISPPASPTTDPSLSEARIILDAYSKVEKDAEKVRVAKVRLSPKLSLPQSPQISPSLPTHSLEE